MSDRRTLARPYAKAIFEIARSSKDYQKWSRLLQVLDLIASNKQVKILLRDKTLAAERIIKFFLEVCGKFLDEPAKNLVSILAYRRRLEVLPEIAALFQEMRNEAENTIEVEFASSIAIDENEKEKFKKILENTFSRSVTMKCVVDKSLFGGFLARAGNYVIDNSLKGFLTELKLAIGE